MSDLGHEGLHGSVASYGNVVCAYERGRPTYPPESVAWVVQQGALARGSVAVDLAAGTGKWTRLLLASGARVIAVEPVAAFREALSELPIQVLDGTAEEIPLANKAVDLVSAAAAFHWFDAPRAVGEIARVLRRHGKLAIIWNERDQRDPTQRALTDLLEVHRRSEPRQSDEAWRAAFDRDGSFASLHGRHFAWKHPFTAETLVERVRSISFVAALEDVQRDALLEDVRALARGRGDTLSLPHITHVYLATRR
jgi:ubiquinone/menaquinone biosynthesis C-methylase UbiE